MTTAQRRREGLGLAIAHHDAKFDPDANLLVTRLGTNYQYHSNLRGVEAHPTRESLTYAIALYEWAFGDTSPSDPATNDRLARAEAVLRRILLLQDRDPDSPTCGLWGWYAEEPPAQMSPPDFNWADFQGVRLLILLQSHGEKLPEELRHEVEEALRRAVTSIRKRDVRPGYTNIALMGSYVTLISAELWNDADLLEYALSRLRRFVVYLREQGGALTEYNSPTYTMVALDEVSRLRRDAKTPEARPWIEEVYRAVWEEIAIHWHTPTGQWAGPHSRYYDTLLSPSALAHLELVSGLMLQRPGQNPSESQYALPDTLSLLGADAPCPDDLVPLLAGPPVAVREVVKTFVQSPDGDPTRNVIGTTYLASDFCLGSASRGDFWNQRRPLIAYWATADGPAYLRLRFLHDDYDFTAARLHSVQKEGRVLATVGIDPDGGDKHPTIDKIVDGTITATRLLLRFEFGGANVTTLREERFTETTNSGRRVVLTSDAISLRFALFVPLAVCEGQEARVTVEPIGEQFVVDIVFYDGEARTFDRNALESLAAALALEIAPKTAPLPTTPTLEGSADVPGSSDEKTFDGLFVWKHLRLTWHGLQHPRCT